MKRLLSVILAISMLMAFVPIVSAADAQPNFTINYDVSGDLAAACGGAAMSAPLSTVNLEYTNGFYALGTTGTVLDWATSSDNFKAYGSGENTNIAMRRWYKSGVKVWVPMAGTYTLKVNYATGLAFSQNKMRVYWNTTGGATGKVGEYKSPEGTYAADEKWNQQFITLSPTPFTATVTAAAPGYYYVAFEVDGTGDNIINGLYARASFASISLVSGSGDGNAIVLGSIDEDFELNAGETKKLSASGYLSKTREAVDFKYISSNPSVATVDENGLVTAKGAGEATITATSKDASDNVTVPLTTKVTVVDSSAYSITYDIGGTIAKYNMMQASSGTSKLDMYYVRYIHTNGFFEYASANPSATAANTSMQALQSTKTFDMQKADGYIEFKIKVPYEGNYKLWMDHDLAKGGSYVDVILDGNRVGSYSCYNANADKNWFGLTGSKNHTQSIAKTVNEDGTLGEEAVFALNAGEHTIRFANRRDEAVGTARGSVGTFKLIKGNTNAVKPMHGYATVSQNGVPVTTLKNGEEAEGVVAVYTTDAVAAAAATTLTSSDTSVIEIDGTRVRAVGQGTATIGASVVYDGTTYDIASYEILVVDHPITGNKVSFYANATEDVALTISGMDYIQGEVDGNVAANTEVTLKAPTDIEGKSFIGWIRGSRDNGIWISDNAELKVRLLTNTFLTAVYEASDEESDTEVRFWNWSGQYLGSETVAKNTTFAEVKKPDVYDFTGYEFAGWSIENETVISKLTNAVAEFEKKAGNYSVTVPSNVGGATSGNYEFDTEITLTSENPVYWERDGKTVDYGTSYSFFVWDDTVITVSDNGNKGPRVILDKHDDYGTYMIEYDNGDLANMRILEAGILFGENATVAGFNSKAVSKKTSFSHGQFTAISNDGADTAATGYVIYLDGGIVRVLYAK